MNSTVRLPRSLLVGTVALLLLSASGCHWVRSKWHTSDNAYTKSPESRPLEVPPDLNMPDTSGSMAIPSAGGPGNSGTVASGEGGFTVAGTASDNWPKVGTLLAATDGVVINGRAEAQSSYDVGYQGQNFLIRVEDIAGQSHIVAISSNGQILRAGPASILLASLQSKL